MKIGVLALQGAFREHCEMLRRLDVGCIEIRNVEDLEGIDGLILPGGESTAMRKLLDKESLLSIIQLKIEQGLPVFGTCAGLILLSKEIEGETSHLSVMDIAVTRNAFGRQLDSFSETVTLNILGDIPFPLVFIRAPIIQSHGKNVEILLKIDDKIVAAKENHMLVTSFHPELTSDLRFHQYFIEHFCQELV